MIERKLWALEREKLGEILSVLADPKTTQAAAEAAKSYAARPAAAVAAESGGSLAVIPVYGLIEQRTSMWGAFFGGTSTIGIEAMVRQAAADASVRAIVLDVSSGGGSIFGVTELHAAIMRARESKPIVAVANSSALSAAYWIASAAHELIATPSAMLGSVGVYAVHYDMSKANEDAGIKQEIISAGDFKADAVEGAPLSDEGRKSLQDMVDHAYGMFVADIAAGRGVDVSTVKADFGKGLVMTAPAAKAAGMVDRIATLDETLKRLSTPQGRSAIMRAAVAEPEPPAPADGEAEIRRRRMAV